MSSIHPNRATFRDIQTEIIKMNAVVEDLLHIEDRENTHNEHNRFRRRQLRIIAWHLRIIQRILDMKAEEERQNQVINLFIP